MSGIGTDTAARRTKGVAKHDGPRAGGGTATPFGAEVIRKHGSVRVSLVGELDLASSGYLQARFADLVEGGPSSVTIDLSGLSFVDLTGLRSLTTLGDAISNTGAVFQIAGVNEVVLRIMRVVDLVGLERIRA